MKWASGLLLLILWGFTAVPHTHAIIIRHDVADEQYLQGEGAYSAVFEIFADRGGVATLIAPQWAITAAHVAQDIPAKHPVLINGESNTVVQTVLHPTWKSDDFVDMGLLQLDRPVASVKPIPIYEQDDERGQTVTFVGWGDTGTGLTGPVTVDHQLRAATNKVERAESKNLVFRFDAPTDENVTPLEGISGPGDSGGPALLEKDEQLYIVGVSVAQDSSGHERGTYGVWEFYTRVSPQAEWIQEVIMTAVPIPTQSVTEESTPKATAHVSNTPTNPTTQSNTRPLLLFVGATLLIILVLGYFWLKSRSN